MDKPYLFWPTLSGTVFLLVGLVAARRAFMAASGLEKLIALAPCFVAAPLAAFGAEHMVLARFVANDVPAWMPGRLFWAYFVGAALIAAAISLTARRHVRLSMGLLGLMLVLFVAMMHLPNALAHVGDRIRWAVAVRDLTFGVCALGFTAGQGERRADGAGSPVTAVRLIVGMAFVFFAIEHFLHPEFAPGVPLQKTTPEWFPIRSLWGYGTGAVLLVGAGAFFVNRQARRAAIGVGLLLLLLTAFLYGPILAVAADSPAMFEAFNYVADTLLFSGLVFLLATALDDHQAPALARQASAAAPASGTP